MAKSLRRRGCGGFGECWAGEGAEFVRDWERDPDCGGGAGLRPLLLEEEDWMERVLEGWFGEAAGWLMWRSSSPQLEMVISERGRSLASTGTLAILIRVSLPDRIWPKTVCLAFRCGHGASVIKNLRYVVFSFPWISVRLMPELDGEFTTKAEG